MEENNEKSANEGTAKAETKTDSNDGNNSERPAHIRQADERVQRLAQENERMERNIAELKDLESRRILDGDAYGGQKQEQKQEESPQDYVKRILGRK